MRFDEENHAEAVAAELGIELPDALRGAVRKRKMEHVAGRHCAIQALRTVLGGFDAAIARAPDRSPQWPSGMVGSITHARGFASAAVARAGAVRSIGIDTEVLLTESALSSIISTIGAAGDPRPFGLCMPDTHYYALLFSAKESVFKCLYPLVQRMFWFEDARVTISTATRTFRALLVTDLHPDFRAGFSVEGQYEFSGEYVHTGLMLHA
ncbi:MAG TPA: 4'-phosphopantetheinyl transferase superfamily protein [Polyangiaceae bacterium]